MQQKALHFSPGRSEKQCVTAAAERTPSAVFRLFNVSLTIHSYNFNRNLLQPLTCQPFVNNLLQEPNAQREG